MRFPFPLPLLSVALAGAAAVAAVRADVVETKGGARLVGTVMRVEDGKVVLKTDYAGEIAVKQSEVVSLTTDGPRVVRLAGGTVMAGTVSPTGDGGIEVRGADGTIRTSVDRVAASWGPDERDPAVVAAERRWRYEAGVDITGKTGNSEQLGTAVSGKATLKGPKDRLQFYAAYDRQETDDEKSADEFRAGLDYSNNFAGRRSWYARTESWYDRVKDIDLYSIAATGLGYDFIKKPLQVLTGRAGVSFRYEAYETAGQEDVKSMGLDFGLRHELTHGNSRLVNELSYVPAFEDFGVFRIFHESYYEIPVKDTSWKLRLGLSHDYNSEPGPGVDELDTTYFTRLVLTWE